MSLDQSHLRGRTANRATSYSLAVRKDKSRGFFIRSTRLIIKLMLGGAMFASAIALVGSGSVLALQLDVFSASAPEATTLAKRVNLALANPAAVHCAQHGGQIRVASTQEGDVGLCKLPNGSICEQWAFIRGECKQTTNKETRPQVEPKEQFYEYSS